MNRYPVRAMLESPLVIRRERQSQRSEGVQYISGTLVRGAFAQAYLQCYGHPDSMFGRLFLDEESCRFGPLDPADRVFPLTVYSCKREPGFVEDHKHGVTDLLGVLIHSRLRGSNPSLIRCWQCDQDLKPHNGFWHLKDDGAPAEPKRR